jgi:hypothetical protein
MTDGNFSDRPKPDRPKPDRPRKGPSSNNRFGFSLYEAKEVLETLLVRANTMNLLIVAVALVAVVFSLISSKTTM